MLIIKKIKNLGAADLEKEIIKTFNYFSLFGYASTFDEIYCFIKTKASKSKLKGYLKRMEEKGVILSQIINCRLSFTNQETISNLKIKVKNNKRYTLGEYSINLINQAKKIKYSFNKIKLISLFIKLIRLFPQVKLVGLSGTVSMFNAKKKDDIDLFVITAKNRLWTGRLICLLLASIVGLRRKRGERNAQDKICLNLFFDEQNLPVPKNKQNEYVAHEVIQMKPLINKNFTYEKFIQKNNWVFNIFPKAKQILSLKNRESKTKKDTSIFCFLYPMLKYFTNIIEIIFKHVQLHIIKKHQTNEIISDTQLWFFPDDFEKKIKYK